MNPSACWWTGFFIVLQGAIILLFSFLTSVKFGIPLNIHYICRIKMK